MSEIETYRTTCNICGEPVYYYPVRLLIESKQALDKVITPKTVDVPCEGDPQHTSSYNFPVDFEKVEN